MVEVFFDSTIVLSSVLAGAVFTIFALLVALQGEALERARREATDQREECLGRLEKLVKGGDLPGVEKITKETRRQLKAIEREGSLLSFRKLVVEPAGLLILAIALAFVSKATVGTSSLMTVGVPVWVLSVVAFAGGLLSIANALRAYERTSLKKYEEEAERRMSEQVATTPVLQFEIVAPSPPVRLPISSSVPIQYRVRLVSGSHALSAGLTIYVPPGFPMRGARVATDDPVENYSIVFPMSNWNFYRGRPPYERPLLLTTPSREGNYRLYYRLTVQGFDSGLQPLDIHVE